MYLFSCLFFVSCYRNPRVLHSFPTRRSSDLTTILGWFQPRAANATDSSSAILLLVILHVFPTADVRDPAGMFSVPAQDRKSTRLNSSHLGISYAVFCLKKKKNTTNTTHIREH